MKNYDEYQEEINSFKAKILDAPKPIVSENESNEKEQKSKKKKAPVKKGKKKKVVKKKKVG